MLPAPVEADHIRQSQYLNNRIERDHQRIKRRVRPMLGLTHAAAVTLSGIEMVHMMRNDRRGTPSIRTRLSLSSSKSSLPHEVATTLANSLTIQNFATEPLRLILATLALWRALILLAIAA